MTESPTAFDQGMYLFDVVESWHTEEHLTFSRGSRVWCKWRLNMSFFLLIAS